MMHTALNPPAQGNPQSATTERKPSGTAVLPGAGFPAGSPGCLESIVAVQRRIPG